MRFLSLLMLGWLLSTCQVYAQPALNDSVADGIVAVIGNKIILKSDIEQEYLQQLGQPGSKITPEMRCQILDQLLTAKLLVRQAEADSLKISDEEVNGQIDRRIRYFSQMVGGTEKLEEFYGKSILEIKEEFKGPVKEQILAGKMQEKLTKEVSISPSEVQAYFNDIPVDSLPFYDSELEVGQLVMFPDVTEVQKQYTIEKLEGIRARIQKGEKFETLAILYSQDPGSAPKGGDLGYFGRGEMVPEFEAAAFRLKPGEVSGIIRTKYGYHLLQLVERRGERVNARHILIKPPVSNSELEKTRRLLDSIKTQLENGQISFREAVKKYSMDDETKANGGMLQNPQNGQNAFTPDQMQPEIYFQVEKLNPGQYSAPSSYATQDGRQGFRIFYLSNKSAPHRCNLNEDYGKIQQAATTRKKGQIMQSWFNKARQRNAIHISPSYLTCTNLKRWIP